MQLTSLILNRKTMLKSLFASLCLAMIVNSSFVIADSLTYSPDQWPRHWNGVMNNTHSKDYQRNSKNREQAPSRSPMWGVVPVAKQKSRRSVRPEYNTNSHMQNYSGQNMYQGNYNSVFPSYGYPASFGVPSMNPYGVSALAPGLAAPGIPFGAYPFMGRPPVMGGYPGMGYMW